MKSEAYWGKRLETLNEAQLNKGEKYISNMKTEYAKSMSGLQRDIDVWYKRFGDNNGIVDMAEARKLLKAGELAEFKWTVQDYIKAGRENSIDQRWAKQLEKASARVHISRLEALQTQMQQKVELLAAKHQTGASKLVGGIYKDNYHRSIFELQKGAGIGSSFAKLDQNQIEKLLTAPWAPDGSNFSSRIWKDRTKLLAELNTTLTQSLIRGDTSESVITAFAERMGVSQASAARIIMTESAYFAGQSRLDAYMELGVTEYKYLATLDKRTSTECRGMDGRVIPIGEAKAGVNYPPLHAHCRSTTIPHYEDNISERTAREDGGKTYSVPGDMTYEDWEKKHDSYTKNPNSGTIEPGSQLPTPEKELKVFTSPAEVDDWEKETIPKWLDSLTVAEQAAIRRYTGSSYAEINTYLRRDGIGNGFLDQTISDISSGLQKFVLPHPVVAYRGMDRNIFGLAASELVGVTFSDKAFVSTTLFQDLSFSGVMQIEIRVPEKTRGAYIRPLSEFMNEYELLLDKGTEFRILDAVEVAGKIKLIAEVIQDER